MIKEFKEILKTEKISGKDMADMLHLSYGSYRAALVDGARTPKWVIAFVEGYKLSKLR